jgi:hypothetical protein
MRCSISGAVEMANFSKRSAALAKNPDVIFDAKPVLKALNQLEPGLRRQMLKEMKAITKPAEKQIRSVIPKTAPMSGMSVPRTSTSMDDRKYNNNGEGRLSWTGGKYKNKVIAPDNVIPRFTSSRSLKATTTSLFGIWLRSPGVSMVSTAGKGAGRSKYATTREYAYKGGVRRHRNNGQGEALIRKVKATGLFNFFYKAGDASIPGMESEVKLVWEKYSKIVNRKLF